MMYAIIVSNNSKVSLGTTQDPTSTSVGASGQTAPTFSTGKAVHDQPPTYYVFDAVLKAAHNRRLRPTENPVQSGANMSAHAIVLPAQVVLEIGMSDAMDAFNANWGGPKKSVAAYNVMLTLQQNRTLLTLATRLTQYTNMLLIGLRAVDDSATRYGLRAELTFQQIFMASAPAGNSVRPDATDSYSAGATSAASTLSQAAQQANVAQDTNTSSLPLVGGATPLASFPITQSPVSL